MRQTDLKNVTGRELKKWWEWLAREQAGCCSVHFASTEKYRYCVCMGWQSGYGPASEERWFGKEGRLRPAFCPPVTPGEEKSGWRICWKIGRQTHCNALQCDYDIDFEMPYVTEAMAKADPKLVEGDVDDTDSAVVLKCGKVVTKGRNVHIESMKLGAPVGYRSWEDFAKYVRRTARRVFRDWKDHDD
jgi:hypothetical protein